ncbi:uncharacterized protein LOC123504624 [Portunus trituberculatus]|uniref:uncharacterized protein LOC123504624 n=1 Tax=Portunus trituberculatus TaxID=210409 RepID=UPI001E1CF41E|nr:uncharacterized protein LOC123504624 [Portunus trituberculatus]
MIHLLHAGAVPLGYVGKMSDTFITSYDEGCMRDTSCHSLAGTETFLLPDIVLSNTPPPTPGHQSCGCGSIQLNTPQPSCPLLPNTPETLPEKAATGEEVCKPQLTEMLDTCCSLQNHLFHLTWTTGTLGSHAHAHTTEERQQREEQQWRHIGGDLRKIADHFELNTSKVWRKNKLSYCPSFPAAVSRCVVASLICLAWWRLYNKLY